LLAGPLHRFENLAMDERSDWLSGIAHDICDPLLRRGELLVYDGPRTCWLPVGPSEPLTASSYLYSLRTPALLALTKICPSEGPSIGNKTSRLSEMHDRVLARDGRCWVSGVEDVGAAVVRICPKRMGDALARRVLADFRGSTVLADAAISDDMFCLVLSYSLRPLFHGFLFGFHHRGENFYDCHDFCRPSEDAVLTVAGLQWREHPHPAPRMHGLRVAPPHP
ncbi:hypothetical protein AURDEDRAFT_46975, partial [Auricularia subglabra TFB-10046 SS5]